MKKIPIILAFILGIFLLYYLNKKPSEIYYSGAIENHNAYIGSKIGGRIQRVVKNEGDTVQQGELILSLEANEQKLKVASLEAKFKQIKLQRQKLLQNSNYNPKDIAIVEAQMDEIQANLELARLFLKECNITAPTHATIERIAVEVGDIITPSKGIIELSFSSKKYAKFYIPQSKLAHIHLGERVEISIDGSEQTYHATISSISQNAEFIPKNVYSKEERDNLLFAIKAKLQEHSLKSGMMIEVRLAP